MSKAKEEQVKCVKCGHWGWWETRRCQQPIANSAGRQEPCGCRCEFVPPPVEPQVGSEQLQACPQQRLNRAVMYALRVGCFFPVPEPRKDATVEELKRWGAMRNLHDAIAVFNSHRSPDVGGEAERGDVERALAELREMFPEYWIRIDRSLRYEPEMYPVPVQYVTISIDKLVDDFEGHSLADAMTAVRKFKAAALPTDVQQEQEKIND